MITKGVPSHTAMSSHPDYEARCAADAPLSRLLVAAREVQLAILVV